jgi:hypothetical protein
MAPLMDHHGETCYFVGAQIDISVLLEGGRGLESFKELLQQDAHKLEGHALSHKPSLKLLRELSGLLNDEELEVVSHRDGRRNSVDSSASTAHTPTRSGQTPTRSGTNSNRRFVGMDEPTGDIWPPTAFGPSGRLPGVYQNVRSTSFYFELASNADNSTCSSDHTHPCASSSPPLLSASQAYPSPSSWTASGAPNMSVMAS